MTVPAQEWNQNTATESHHGSEGRKALNENQCSMIDTLFFSKCGG